MMKRILLFALVGLSAYAQTIFRVDPAPVMTTTGTAPYGSYPTLLAVPGATVKLCLDSACATPATTYTSATGLTACSSTAQVVLAGTHNCTPYSDQRGNFGFWVAAGTYFYKVTLPNGTVYGPYALSNIIDLPNYKQPLTGSVERTFNAKDSDVVNVADFGAKGDGLTDDTAAFAAAFAASRHIEGTNGKVYVVKDLVVPSTAPPAGSYEGFIFDGHGATVKIGSGGTWGIKFTDAGISGQSYPNGNHREIWNWEVQGTGTSGFVFEGGCFWDNHIRNIIGAGTMTNLLHFVQSPTSPCQPGSITISDVTSYYNVFRTLYFEAVSPSGLNLWDDFRISHIWNYSDADNSATIAGSVNAYLSNSYVQGVIKSSKGSAILWNAGNSYAISSRFADIYSESAQSTCYGFVGYAAKSKFENVRLFISSAAAQPNCVPVYIAGTSSNVIVEQPEVTDSGGGHPNQVGSYPLIRMDAPGDSLTITGIQPQYLVNSLAVDPAVTHVWTPFQVLNGRLVVGPGVDDGSNQLQVNGAAKFNTCCVAVDSALFSQFDYYVNHVKKWSTAADGFFDFQIINAAGVNKMTIDHTTGKVNAPSGWSAAGNAGITATITTGGCTMTFTLGLLTGKAGC